MQNKKELQHVSQNLYKTDLRLDQRPKSKM